MQKHSYRQNTLGSDPWSRPRAVLKIGLYLECNIWAKSPCWVNLFHHRMNERMGQRAFECANLGDNAKWLYFLTSRCMRISVVPDACNTWYCQSLFMVGPSGGCVMRSHYSFNLHFSDDQSCWISFYLLIAYLILSFWVRLAFGQCGELIWVQLMLGLP